MRLQVNDYGFDAQLPDNEEESLIESSQKMFSILSDAIYKDKILAVLRELSCNARDAMYDAGKRNLPFRLKLPTALDPIFRVEDDGIGIHPSEMRNVYLTYGRSSKTEDNNAIGALGLGSKSPFAYTKSSFIVKNRWHSAPSTDPEAKPITEYTYFIFINQKGKPAITLVGAEPTDQERGITVEFAVKTGDISNFINRADRFFRYWKDVMPTFVDYDEDEVLTTKTSKVIDSGDWYLEERDQYADFKGAYAIMGNVPYPILVDSIPDMPEDLKIIAKNSFIIEFPLGTLAFQPSREDLSYDEFTCKNLIERLEHVRKEFATQFKSQMFNPGQTQVEFRQNFYTSMTKLGNVIRNETRGYIDNNEWVCRFIFGSHLKSATVVYDNHTYGVLDLFNRVVNDEHAGYQPFNIISKDVRGKNARVYLKACTDIKVNAIVDVPYVDIFGHRDTWMSRHIHAGETFTYDWQSRVFSQKKSDQSGYSTLQRVYLNDHKFDFSSLNNFHVHATEVTFIVNDDGGHGEPKFKAMIDAHDYEGDVFFVKFNPKEVSVSDVCVQLQQLIERAGLKGAKVVFSSTIEDHRPPVVKEKTDSGSIKLHYTKFTHLVDGRKTDVDMHMYRKYPCTNINVPAYTKHNMKVFNVDDLVNSAKPWLYVIKTRARREIFDPLGKTHVRSMLTQDDRTKFRIAVSAGLFDDVMYEKIADGSKNIAAPTPGQPNAVIAVPTYRHDYTVLVLNEGQVGWLQKKGVKLVSIRAHAEMKMKAELAAHNFIQDIEEEVVMDNVEIVSDLYEYVDVNSMKSDQDSLFKSILKKYDDFQKNKHTKAKSYMWMTLYRAFVDASASPNTSRAHDINTSLKQTYPILKMVSFKELEQSDVDHLIEYVEMSDRKLIA